ncbi:aminoglycoside phosphotransferase family protein [Kushneria phosphatilytica]|uniref:Phosphotransferase n=1 Tax=Kushneria phosphatilytica TaxID=657387 RepID=A0A1S1NXY5_9GAMM|nr:phosphotransferase [Kushneria phosphatilytica]OHV12735.1 hypothetical protein BH688_01390 [Kushneria phosphatilytica]QEL10577.1 phosphotransferase [Kushneria phosphatilytica]
MDTRLDALRQWVAQRHRLRPDTLDLGVIADDASFRRYFRLTLPDGSTRILMDAPPEQEDCRAFVEIASQWRQGGLPVPRIEKADIEQGFIELQDLGDIMLRSQLQELQQHPSPAGSSLPAPVINRMAQAIELAVDVATQPADQLPSYDSEWLGRELDLFPQWCLHWLSLTPPDEWPRLRDTLISSMIDQPQVTVHRDFHPQNLMCHQNRLWIIDFQGAVRGPLTYDPASLLRDRNPAWPDRAQRHWIEAWHRRAHDHGLIEPVSARAIRELVDASATQRSLKVLGLFCRLAHRDGKSRYLRMLPLFAEHVRQGLNRQQFGGFHHWFEHTFMPGLDARLSESTSMGGAS